MNNKSNSYFITDCKLSIENSVLVFDYSIRDALEMGDILVVRVEKPFKTIYNENVFGISLSEKQIKWQIAKREYKDPDCPFISISIFGDLIKLFNWCGFYLIVNPLSGEILEEGLPSKY